MNSWKSVKDLIIFSTKGITPKYVDISSVIVLNQKCIRNNKIDYSLAKYTKEDKVPANKLIQVGDILINSTGQGTAGRCAFVNDLPEGARVIVDSHILLLRCNTYYEAQCLSYSLFSFEKTLQSFMDGSTGQGELDKVRLFNILIQLPKHKNQQKIASILSTLDKKIELNNQINQKLEAMAKTLYDYWFVQFDFPDANGKPYKSSGGKMVYSEELKREIPEGWEVKSLNEIALIKKGTLITEKTANLNGKYKVVSAGIDYSYFHSEYNRDKFTITISASGANAGFINFWREKFFACDCTTVNGKSITETFLILEFLKLRQNYIYKQARGSAQPHVYPKDIASLKMEIYPKNLVEKFGKVAISLNEQIAINQKLNQKLTQLRDWLLPMLMNGQVTISDAKEPIDNDGHRA